MDLPIIQSLHIGKEVSLANTGYYSAINKHEIKESQYVRKEGLILDSQADKKNHGGKDKALHQYAFENYSYWKQKYPNQPLLSSPAAFGENISSLGMNEDMVCIGDVYRLGSCIIEVSQARQPCWKLNFRFGIENMAVQVQNSLKTGWYYRVIQEGKIKAGDIFELDARPHPEYSLTRILKVLYLEDINIPELNQMIELKPLAESWKRILKKRIDTGIIENWEKRLFYTHTNN
ncbi:MOSC domain-containing protein [Apibacter muscae]|uniref:MOSC domain-containing protein n=1 Tax=Apibacter muscae TaxID=2509004 RepID=A0A563DGV8_9FLAO|nr:MOSC domain-containing protein [Apibacter muscae]TWP29064.1 MOSC domain-containing protein [Apibacter muscae]